MTVTVLHPGVVRTAFGAEDPARWQRLFLPLVRRFMKTPDRGAETSIYLASAPEGHGVTGRYFANRKPKRSSKDSYDTAAQTRLWQVSAELIGLAAGHTMPSAENHGS